MLNINKSQLRTKLLRLYFSRPQKEYYIRELERLISKPASNIHQELKRLEKMGLFKSQFKGKQRYYSLNKDYPLYKEIKSIVFKTIGAKGSLQKILKNFDNIEIAFIFGSYAKEKQDTLSDIDLMIIGKPDEDILISKITELEDKLDREINYHIYKKSDLREKTKQNTPFIKNVLENKKIFLIGDKNELSKIN